MENLRINSYANCNELLKLNSDKGSYFILFVGNDSLIVQSHLLLPNFDVEFAKLTGNPSAFGRGQIPFEEYLIYEGRIWPTDTILPDFTLSQDSINIIRQKFDEMREKIEFFDAGDWDGWRKKFGEKSEFGVSYDDLYWYLFLGYYNADPYFLEWYAKREELFKDSPNPDDEKLFQNIELVKALYGK